MARGRVLAGVLLLILGVSTAALGQQMLAAVEAEFIERFTRFIEWPAGSSASDAAVPFVIGVLGDSPIVASLGDLAKRARIKGKAIEVRQLSDLAEADACQLVFLAATHKDRAAALAARVKGRPILTVADSPGLAHAGIMINFTQNADFIRFELNPNAAKSSKLRMASELLALGEVVK